MSQSAPLQAVASMPPLTSSEMRAWQVCPRGWFLTYWRRLLPTRDLPSLPNIGNLYHGGMQIRYESPDADPFEWLRERGERLIAEYPEMAPQILADVEMAAIMLEGRFQWGEEEGEDANREFVAAEQVVEAPVGPYVLRGKIDARFRRTWNGALVQWEYKTVGSLKDIPKYAQSAPQFLTYSLLSYLTKPDGVATEGIVIDMARRVKRTARAQPPFYALHPVYHNAEELRAHYRHVIAVGGMIERARDQLSRGVEHHDACPPAVDKDHAWKCRCHDACSMFDDGSDVEGYLAEFYEEHDPWARYAPEKEDD